MPASKMSLTARLTMSMSVLVSEMRPVYFLLSLDVFQMQAITDMLPATETPTQIDSSAMSHLSTRDMEYDGSIQLMNDQVLHAPVGSAGCTL